MEGKCKGTETQRNISNKGDLQITTAHKIHINTNKHARKETMHDDNCSDQPLSLRGSVSAIENDSISEDFVLAKGTLGFVPSIIVCPVSSDDVFGFCTALYKQTRQERNNAR
jgi:hypothetical protein